MIKLNNALDNQPIWINLRYILAVYWDKQDNITKVATAPLVIYNVRETCSEVLDLIKSH